MISLSLKKNDEVALELCKFLQNPVFEKIEGEFNNDEELKKMKEFGLFKLNAL